MIVNVRVNATTLRVDVQVEKIEDLDVDTITAGDELNFLVATEIKDWESVGIILGPMEEGEMIILLEPGVWTWPKLLAHLKCFSSASQAAKSLIDQYRGLNIEKGFSDFLIGEARKIRISLWNPYMPERL